MLDNETKRRIDTARDVLVGKVPDPKSQVEQITIALVYKFMDDMDKESIEMGGKPSFFTGDYEKYSWTKIFDPRLGGFENACALFRWHYTHEPEPKPATALSEYFQKCLFTLSRPGDAETVFEDY